MMKLLILILTVLTFINVASAVTGYVTITPMGQTSSSDNSQDTPVCESEVVGQGYYLPCGTQIQVGDYCYQLDFANSSSNLMVSYFGFNCSLTNPIVHFFPIGECTSFSFFDSQFFSFNSVIQSGKSIPDQAISYYYYYYSYYCSGPTYQIFYTNGFADSLNKYQCDNGKPEVYNCDPTGSCEIEEIKGCQLGKEDPMPYRVEC